MATRTPTTSKNSALMRLLCSALAALFMSNTVMAAATDDLNIAQKPLFLGGTDPNIMFILDASGSMSWSYIPDKIGRRALSGTDAVVTAKTTHSTANCLTSGWKKGLTSSSYNALYYDPAVTYLPPMNADGSTKANSTWPSAKPDGYLTSTALDLTKQYQATWGSNQNGSTDVGSMCYNVDTAVTGSGSSVRSAYYNKLTGTTAACTTIDTSAPPPADECFTTTTVSTSSGPSRARPELGGTISTNETINFANWFSYYRTRINTAKAGISRAFAQAGTSMYMGYGMLNSTSVAIDGLTTNTIARGVRPFKDYSGTTDPFPSGTTYRSDFFTWLFGKSASNGTPLRESLDYAGKYYETSTAAYSSKPWDPSTGNAVSCRQSYSILMTDGYWNGNAASTAGATANTDSTSTGLDSTNGTTSITYSARAPFTDGFASTGTLADVAMYYWKRDLRSTLTNNVPVSSTSIDKAFWQHMTTFTIGFGVAGSINSTRAFNSITATSGSDFGYPSLWPDPTVAQNETRVDDLLHAGVNGHGGFYSAKNPTEFSNALTSTLSAIAARSSSATSVSTNGTRLTTDSMVYQATFNSGSWSGDVLGYSINPSTQALTLLSTASAGLPAASARKIYTWNPATSAGVLFQWANLSTTASTGQQARITTGISTALGSTSTVTGPQLVDYVRGDHSLEVSLAGSLRNRTSVLGDIINSDPVFASKDDFGYGSATSIPAAQRASYTAFVAAQVPMLYAGANDGMLHAFDGSSVAGSALKEIFAYVPNNVLDNLPYLAKATDFSHKYFVDGPVTVGHAYLGGAWKTVLVGATGAGGKSYFALDVTTPNTPTVLWEFTHTELGNTLGKAAITRMPDGTWAAIFGNGYNSTSGNAALFIVNLQTGALMTGANPLTVTSRDTTLANGLATPIEADANRDGSTDVVYAGDLQGSMWKFNLSSATSSAWATAFGGKPLFQTPSKTVASVTSYPQAITSQPQVARHPLGGAMVFFGTGKFFETGDQSNTSLQTYYGVRDECLLNTGTGCGTLSAPKVTPSQLLAQTFTESTVSGNTIRTMSKNKDTTKMGWYVNLQVAGSSTDTGERVIANSTLLDDRVIFTSIIPNEDVCGFGGDSWLFELDLFTGGATDFSVFDLNNDGIFTAADKGNARKISGLVKTPSISAKDEKTGYTFTGTSDPALRVDRINLNRTIGRQTWRQVR